MINERWKTDKKIIKVWDKERAKFEARIRCLEEEVIPRLEEEVMLLGHKVQIGQKALDDIQKIINDALEPENESSLDTETEGERGESESKT